MNRIHHHQQPKNKTKQATIYVASAFRKESKEPNRTGPTDRELINKSINDKNSNKHTFQLSTQESKIRIEPPYFQNNTTFKSNLQCGVSRVGILVQSSVGSEQVTDTS